MKLVKEPRRVWKGCKYDWAEGWKRAEEDLKELDIRNAAGYWVRKGQKNRLSVNKEVVCRAERVGNK